MQFLKTIFWVALAVIAVIFSFNNWTETHIALWAGMTWETKLPVPLFLSFLLGLIPALALHRATRWSLRRKLDSAERALSDIRVPASIPVNQPAAPEAEPAQAPAPMPTPIAVPPGVA